MARVSVLCVVVQLMLPLVLKVMHNHDWIHRDISVANIYEFEGRGLFGDLEYAKKGDDDTEHLFRMVRSTFDCSLIAFKCFSNAGYALLYGRRGNGM